MNKNVFVFALTTALLLNATANAARFDEVERVAAAEVGLQETKTRLFDEALMVEAFEIDSNAKVYVAPLNTDDVDVDDPQFNRHNRTWDLTEKDKQGMEAMYQTALMKELSKSTSVELIDRAEPGAIRIEAKLLEINPTAPKDDFKGRSVGQKYVTEGSGTFTIEIDISQGGHLLMKLIDEKRAGNRWELNDSFHNKSNTKQAFNQLARNLIKQVGLQAQQLSNQEVWGR